MRCWPLLAAACAVAVEAARAGRQVPAAAAPAPQPAAAPWGQPAPAVSPFSSPPLVAPPTHSPSAVAGAYGLLRASGRRIGGAVGDLAGVQAGLASLQQELHGEYDRWKARRKVHVQERELLQSEVNHVRALLDRRKATRQERTHLQQGLAVLAEEAKAANATSTRAHREWEMERARLQMDVDALQDQANATRALHAARREEAENATAAIQNQSRPLEEGVRLLEGELHDLTNFTARRRQNLTDQLVKLAGVTQALQGRLAGVQAEAKSQAVLQAHLDDEHRRIAERAGQVLAQREQLRAAMMSCNADLLALDEKVGAEQRAFAKAKAEFLACRTLEAEAQRLQEQLTICRAGLRAGG